MKLYKYNPETKIFIKIVNAQEDPKREGYFFQQKNATDKPIPEYNENQIPKFKNNKWILIPNYKGKIFWNKETKEKIKINNYGVEPDENMTDKEPPREDYYIFSGDEWIIDISKYNDAKIFELRRIRNNIIINTIWIMERHIGELKGLEKGITTKPTTITDAKYEEWLLYWEALRDLPANINLENIDIEDIIETNNSIFPQPPIG